MSRAETIQSIRACAEDIRRLGATGVYMFGSAARDQLEADSDVDLFIDYDPQSDFSFVGLVRIRQLLTEKLGREVDLTTREGLHPRLRAGIEQTSLRVL